MANKLEILKLYIIELMNAEQKDYAELLGDLYYINNTPAGDDAKRTITRVYETRKSTLEVVYAKIMSL